MNKKYMTLGLIFGIMLLMATAVLANKAHNGKAQHLYLFEKDPFNWNIVEDGAWGKMMYKEDTFVFNGHGLVPEKEYCLINYAPSTDWDEIPYPNPWPGSDSILMASGIVNDEGNIHLTGSMMDVEGKVWLVLCDEFNEGTGMQWPWTPSLYLFENNLI